MRLPHSLSAAVFALMLAIATAMVTIVAGPALQAAAVERTEGMSEEEYQRQLQLEKVYNIEVASNKIKGWPKGPGTYGESACVMDMETGAVLYDKKMDTKQFPASITKVMTAYVTLKYGDMNSNVKFYHEDVAFLEGGDASIGMEPGEVITMKEAMYAMLLHSANEVSHAIIRTVGGQVRKAGKIDVPGVPTKGANDQVLDYQWGIGLMNMEAAMLGCKNTHFVNSYGLHDDKHYVSAHDMCLIGSAAYRYDYFKLVTQTLHYTIPKKKTTKDAREFRQNHKMLYPENENYYANCTGGKTGFTDQAASTLITFAEKDGKKLVACVLHTYGRNVYPDTRALLEYGFNNFEHKTLSLNDISKIAGERSSGRKVTMVTDETTMLTVPKKTDMSKVTGKTVLNPMAARPEEQIFHFYFNNMPVGSIDVQVQSLHQSVIDALDLSRERLKDDYPGGK